jgi:hypothetical protein
MAKAQKSEEKVQISVGVHPSLLTRLEAAAARAFRSLSGEAAKRLQDSFEREPAA